METLCNFVRDQRLHSKYIYINIQLISNKMYYNDWNTLISGIYCIIYVAITTSIIHNLLKNIEAIILKLAK